MASNQLLWQDLLPDLTEYQPVLDGMSSLPALTPMQLQPRLSTALATFANELSHWPFMLLKAEDSFEKLALLNQFVNEQTPNKTALFGVAYHFDPLTQHVTAIPAKHANDNFAADNQPCHFSEWVEYEQLFGTLKGSAPDYQLQAGLLHKANGGILLLPVRTLLNQPKLWFRLKQTIVSGRFEWVSESENTPLPIHIPSMPLSLKLILVGDRLDLDDFGEFEPEIAARAFYGEFEYQRFIKSDKEFSQWLGLVKHVAAQLGIHELSTQACHELILKACRATEDKALYPIDPLWIKEQLQLVKSVLAPNQTTIDEEDVRRAYTQKQWREGYLFERSKEDFLLGQIRVETEGFVTGQVNGLSVLEYPGYPIAIGEPSRISCIVHIGDGEVTDIERKAELGGNLHAKGMMIMQSFIHSELSMEQQLPFSASIVFEQSYGEVDGDSATLAELCAFMSALSLQPINQQIAITGSVDQFGNVQPIGGVNQKIEAFFDLCSSRGLTGSQGVIIPKANQRHLCLKEEVISAVKSGQFSIFTVDHASEAVAILIGLPYRDDEKISVISLIQERISISQREQKQRFPWPFHWLN